MNARIVSVFLAGSLACLIQLPAASAVAAPPAFKGPPSFAGPGGPNKMGPPKIVIPVKGAPKPTKGFVPPGAIKPHGGPGVSKGPVSVPELSGTGAAGGAAVLLGAFFLLSQRRRRRAAQL